ncbi:bifunctional phosphoribosylaminoimidazolecarboxamide formyltransferase/IMP cyclohydrolase [Flavobacterium sp.]|uniref:bifunctional phosphoribosylaminoimidazolecarboxamide formyltransferase/IMP cyclohydrolase n=1 Tax=Flavobacterium sp. TaxID=239 RepID=UPI002636EFBC|nr:bifunctional phosphoribosylaminoimidazolecarboxamide formyltransferase/IMP cyclohydrolase [Flavobacterium sp.]MDG2431478.1 bifunctional phosphoribosylaminoimidazolecarboxamide formyltransferase/IMP cyclohydrolase [Flavobacterium sp.]
MSTTKTIQSALISVFSKEGLEPIVRLLNSQNVTLYSTGGTEEFIKNLGIPVIPVEDVTSYPSILGGRVKTLHPKVFGGILNRQDNPSDVQQMEEFNIPQIDLVIVDLYPFEKTVASGATEADIIEKIDIGGISLIRAAAKNFKDTVIVASVNEYSSLLEIITAQNGATTLEDRKLFATKAFHVSSHYDTAIFNYFNTDETVYKASIAEGQVLRYGENPHQKGFFFGKFDAMFNKIHGKELSYNNLLDVDAAVHLINEFKNDGPTFAILKHNNACGLASRKTISEAYVAALACDPTSAFGGVLISNTTIDVATALEINKLFCEVVIAPKYEEKAIAILEEKKNRIILIQNEVELPNKQVRTCLNGLLIQERNTVTDNKADLKTVTTTSPTEQEIEDLIFASKVCKNTKSNTIVFAKNGTLISSGTGQTSRVDALVQAVEKAKAFGFDLKGASMASDAFFPFPDCVQLAKEAGITAVIQPGGSIKDQLSIDYCNENKLAMVFTGTRHFKH